jgi:hypothetical protein
VDIFASSNNAKTKLFYSLYWNPCALGVNSLNSDWSSDVNWLLSPVPLASTAIYHLVKCKAKGTLIVPKWTSPFWPLIFEDGLEYKSYVTERILEAGMNVNSISARNFSQLDFGLWKDKLNIRIIRHFSTIYITLS